MAFFQFAQAIRTIFDIGFEPREDSFSECSPAQYRSLATQGYDPNQRWYVVTRGLFEQANNPPDVLRLVDESERRLLLGAAAWIYKTTDQSGEVFTSFEGRMTYLRARLPDALLGTSTATRVRPHLVREDPEP